jgi:predicted metalloprotease
MSRFVSAIVAGNEKVWGDILQQQKNVRFTPATLVEFSGATRSGCGTAQSAMGPFYCPNDRKIYLDMSFFRDMQRKLGGGGDFAYAYVISHEYGHHIQNLIGLLQKTQQAQHNATSQGQANAISVRVELMADCLAGVWAANAEKRWHFLEQGDVEKAINTAQTIVSSRLPGAAALCPILSHTVRRSSACNGCNAGCNRVRSIPATRSRGRELRRISRSIAARRL